ncbi:MAG: molybdopterin molybdenumtransferase MoeA, partial [Chloroflexi bacterium CFX6]|nr:molybdopterin molybdenumtransferase MoeA [Chloroflexi bacterium CFX6]
PGSDVAAGDTVAEPGHRLGPAHLGLLASIGIGEVKVHRRPRVACFSTGDELRGIGEPLAPGQIHDSNRYTLHGLVTRAGAEVLDLGVVPDRVDAVRAAVAHAAAHADAVVTTGGVSVGDTDHVKAVVEDLGRVDFWRIAMKPGKPLAVGRVGEAMFFGLPGNPVSAAVTASVFVVPALRRLGGERSVDPVVTRARLTAPVRKQPGRLEYQRGVLSAAADGALTVTPMTGQDSHLLAALARADCLIVLPLDCGDVAAGAWVAVQPFCGLWG